VIKNKKDIKTLKVTLDRTAPFYDGTPKEIGVTVANAKDKNDTPDRGVDYDLFFTNNVHAGTAYVTVVGKGEYSGVVTKKYTIKAADDAQVDVTGVKASYVFQNTAVTIDEDIKVTDRDGALLTPGQDYRLTYSGNRKAGKAKFKVTFLGDYKRTKAFTKDFVIAKGTLKGDTEGLEVWIGDVAYTGKPGAYKADMTVSIGGRVLKKSDYTVTYYKDEARTKETKLKANYIQLSKGQEAATVYVKITGRGNFAGTDLSSSGQTAVQADQVTSRTAAGGSVGVLAQYQVVNKASTIDLSKVRVTVLDESGNKLSKAEYTGEELAPSVRVEYKDPVTKKWSPIPESAETPYDIHYADNTDKGKAVIVLTGNGEETVGRKMVYFTIASKNITLAK